MDLTHRQLTVVTAVLDPYVEARRQVPRTSGAERLAAAAQAFGMLGPARAKGHVRGGRRARGAVAGSSAEACPAGRSFRMCSAGSNRPPRRWTGRAAPSPIS